jgi:hypothetical protein
VARGEERYRRRLRSVPALLHRRPWLRKVEAEAKKLRERDRKRYGATSFVVELRNIPYGVRFTDADSYHQTSEVGFDRPSGPYIGERASRIVRVWPVLDGRKLPALTPDDAARLVLKRRKASA